ncbi:hypothetical protein M011DRAFT_27485 [Sporormia fimetaria CBS 119925]|uniref:Uncharacterized protein n=1 Tax=Sporormia fimetaria CBS 119925 TaxID=1340428 RepID=A0A6A6VBN9_9PLEO|nr:hypothetical protein M011DRAFT_27485 [Sporormia fimetaria CBS 119925]
MARGQSSTAVSTWARFELDKPSTFLFTWTLRLPPLRQVRLTCQMGSISTMSLKSLALRTKKSLSGIYNFGKAEQPAPSVPETPKPKKEPKETPKNNKKSATPSDGGSPRLQEFGMSPSSGGSSKTGSPSQKRSSRLARSLRRMRSSFDGSKKGQDGEYLVTPIKQTLSIKHRPSLGLAFQASPTGQPIFNSEAMTSRTDIVRSSPITVPGSDVENTPSHPSLPPGTVPNTPAPLAKVVLHLPSDSPERGHEPPPTPGMAVELPLPTPMPGTNFPLEELDTPEIVVSSPSIPSLQDGYFALSLKNGTASHPAKEDVVPTRAPESQPNLTITASPTQAPDTIRVVTNTPTTGDQNKRTSEHESSTRDSWEQDGRYVSAYLALGAQEKQDDADSKAERRQSIWGRHSGLYDGTGYAPSDTVDDESGRPDTAAGSAKSGVEPSATDKKTPTLAAAESVNAPSAKDSLQDIVRAYTLFDEGREVRDEKHEHVPAAQVGGEVPSKDVVEEDSKQRSTTATALTGKA